MDYKFLQLEKEGKLAVLTINRPEALNALNKDVLLELASAIDALAQDSEVWCLILTGAGAKAFVAGADIAAMSSMSPLEAKDFAKLGQSLFTKIESLNKPVIAAINGFALGGGCELAMACDLRLAADSARFGQPEVKLGITPGFGGTQRLAWLIGKGRAKELIFTGGMIDAAKALAWGLVNDVVPAAELLPKAKELAGKIIANSPVAVSLSKDAINRSFDAVLDMDMEAELFADCFAAQDQKVGMTAFLNKQAPAFPGK